MNDILETKIKISNRFNALRTYFHEFAKYEKGSYFLVYPLEDLSYQIFSALSS